jgi:hypothetical protein
MMGCMIVQPETRTKNALQCPTMQGNRTRPKKPRPPMTATRDGNIYGRTESESESELEMSGGEMAPDAQDGDLLQKDNRTRREQQQ